MPFALLHRVNPEKNEARFYLVPVQGGFDKRIPNKKRESIYQNQPDEVLVLVGPSLLDEYAILRVWGRLGGQQRAKRMVTPCASAEEARIVSRRLVQLRLRRGYQIVQGSWPWCRS